MQSQEDGRTVKMRAKDDALVMLVALVRQILLVSKINKDPSAAKLMEEIDWAIDRAIIEENWTEIGKSIN